MPKGKDLNLPDTGPFEGDFLKIIYSLKPYLNHFVLVGGWAPYLYSRYLWKNLSVLPVSTLDIDIGIREIRPYWKDKPLFTKFKKLRYKLEPVYDKEPVPSIPVYVDEKKRLEIRIEFITSFYVSDDTINHFLGKEIAIHRIDEFEWLLDKIIALRIPYKGKIIKLNLPQPYIYLFHKGLTFTMREDDVKKAKDLYYLYYILRFHPKYEELVSNIRSLEDKEAFKIFIQNLKEGFDSKIAEGPLRIESVSGFDPYMPSIRNDAYTRVQKFITDLG